MSVASSDVSTGKQVALTVAAVRTRLAEEACTAPAWLHLLEGLLRQAAGIVGVQRRVRVKELSLCWLCPLHLSHLTLFRTCTFVTPQFEYLLMPKASVNLGWVQIGACRVCNAGKQMATQGATVVANLIQKGNFTPKGH